jgi:hypothetical protein
MTHVRLRPTFIASTVLSILVLGAVLRADHPSEFTTRDKSEVFIQHVVKFLNLAPEKYQALVLEYEVAAALAEAAPAGDPGAAAILSVTGDFIANALAQLYPEFGEARDLARGGKDDEARGRLRPLSQHLDPYLAANARLLAAEIDFRAAQYDSVIQTCQTLVNNERLRLSEDYKACELIARSFAALEKPVLEFAQYYLLLIDYQELPPELEKRAQSRLQELNDKIGQPLDLVAGWMNQVEKALKKEVTGDETQKQEKEIVTTLDKLIELQEAQERQSCKNCGNCAGGACRGNGRPRGNRSSSPALVSALPPPGEGSVNLLGVSRANADSIWGQLRLRDASRALQSFSGKLPARYERLLEQYYKDLAREQ